jgi:hypothetical protein
MLASLIRYRAVELRSRAQIVLQHRVTPNAYQRGHYTRIYRALRQWITVEFPFSQRPTALREFVVVDRRRRSG